MIWFLVFCVFSCYLIIRLVQRYVAVSRQLHFTEKMPGPPLKSKILGNVEETICPPADMPTMAYARYKEYGSIFRLWIGGLPLVLVAEGKYAEVLFTSKCTEIKNEFYRFLYVWLGQGLLTSRGQLWHQRRKLITPAFHFSILSDFCDVFINNTLTLIDQLRQNPDGTLVNVMTQMKLIALDNICETAMGIKIDALKNPNHNYIRAVEDTSTMVMTRMTKPWLWNEVLFFLSPTGRKHWLDLSTIFELTDMAIKNRRCMREDKGNHLERESEEFEGSRKMAFLDLLLEACEKNSVSLSDEDLRDEVNTFMFEGHDTTAVSMGYTLFLLGNHPEIQDKCHQELDDIFQGSKRKPTMGDLQKMKYLEQVIKESLRLFPSVPMLGREVAEDMQVGNYTVPKGALLGINLYNLHRDPKVFPDPDKFDPDHFSPEKSAGRHPYAYVPFAAGPRNCIGQKFALMEEKVVLSYILRDFQLESEHGLKDLKISFALIIRSQEDLNVKFTRRKSCQSHGS
nr:PREDICTED: cytochrome P450 4C1-like isoform X1 [Bemisia tabaci]